MCACVRACARVRACVRMCVRTEMCMHSALCYILFNLICNLTTFSKEFFFLLFEPIWGLGVCKNGISACMVLCVTFPFIDMQHDHSKQKQSFDPLTLGVEGVCKDKICVCMVICVPFPLF